MEKQLKVEEHLNYEKIMRYYLLFLPPRGCKNILDIGCGVSATYKGMLQPRTKEYIGLDIRKGYDVDIIQDLINMKDLKNKSFSWGWCVDVIEHIEPSKKLKAVKEIMRVCDNCIFIYPRPDLYSNDKNVVIKSFYDDPGHSEVKINWKKEFSKNYNMLDKSTKNGRAIFILTKKSKTWKQYREQQEKYDEDIKNFYFSDKDNDIMKYLLKNLNNKELSIFFNKLPYNKNKLLHCELKIYNHLLSIIKLEKTLNGVLSRIKKKIKIDKKNKKTKGYF